MKVAVIQFPGSTCDRDVHYTLIDALSLSSELIWHTQTSLGDAEAVILPGGASYGDYLRPGALATTAPIMKAIHEFADRGGRVLGICNGFQTLCEAKLLPGALVYNTCLEFRCHIQDLTVENSSPTFNPQTLGSQIRVPIAHSVGNFQLDGIALDSLEANNQVLFRYSGERGNPNGSLNQIAGIRNRAGNVFGMMPHPESAASPHHRSQDGLKVLSAFLESSIL